MMPMQAVVSVVLGARLFVGPATDTAETPAEAAPSVEAAGEESDAQPGRRAAQGPTSVEAPAEPAAPEPSVQLPSEPVDEEAWEDDEAWDEDEEWADDYDPQRDSPAALESQRRIAGGAVVLGLGALVSFGGLGMLLSDPCARPAGNSCSSAARNRAALTMALPGIAAMATGAVMLGLGVRQRRALRAGATVSRAGGTLMLRGRF